MSLVQGIMGTNVLQGEFRAPFMVPGLEEDVTGTWIAVLATAEESESQSKEQLAYD